MKNKEEMLKKMDEEILAKQRELEALKWNQEQERSKIKGIYDGSYLSQLEQHLDTLDTLSPRQRTQPENQDAIQNTLAKISKLLERFPREVSKAIKFEQKFNPDSTKLVAFKEQQASFNSLQVRATRMIQRFNAPVSVELPMEEMNTLLQKQEENHKYVNYCYNELKIQKQALVGLICVIDKMDSESKQKQDFEKNKAKLEKKVETLENKLSESLNIANTWVNHYDPLISRMSEHQKDAYEITKVKLNLIDAEHKTLDKWGTVTINLNLAEIRLENSVKHIDYLIDSGQHDQLPDARKNHVKLKDEITKLTQQFETLTNTQDQAQHFRQYKEDYKDIIKAPETEISEETKEQIHQKFNR